jgi:hypothetical protein
MESFIKVLKILRCHPIQVFAQAFDYFEVRFTEGVINETFASCCDRDKDKTLLVRIPMGVQLYLNEVLLGARPINDESIHFDGLDLWTGEVKGEK